MQRGRSSEYRRRDQRAWLSHSGDNLTQVYPVICLAGARVSQVENKRWVDGDHPVVHLERDRSKTPGGIQIRNIEVHCGRDFGVFDEEIVGQRAAAGQSIQVQSQVAC